MAESSEENCEDAMGSASHHSSFSLASNTVFAMYRVRLTNHRSNTDGHTR